MEQREQKLSLLGLCRVATEEDNSQGGKAMKWINPIIRMLYPIQAL